MEIEDLTNRFQFHPATTKETKKRHEEIRRRCLGLAFVINNEVPESEEKKEAIKRLEEVMFWANAGIARHTKDLPGYSLTGRDNG